MTQEPEMFTFEEFSTTMHEIASLLPQELVDAYTLTKVEIAEMAHDALEIGIAFHPLLLPYLKMNYPALHESVVSFLAMYRELVHGRWPN